MAMGRVGRLEVSAMVVIQRRRRGEAEKTLSLPFSPVAGAKTRRRVKLVEFLEQHLVRNRYRKSNSACWRKKKQQLVSWEKKRRENCAGRGGKERSCNCDNKGRSKREDKDGPFVFPGRAAARS